MGAPVIAQSIKHLAQVAEQYRDTAEHGAFFFYDTDGTDDTHHTHNR